MQQKNRILILIVLVGAAVLIGALLYQGEGRGLPAPENPLKLTYEADTFASYIEQTRTFAEERYEDPQPYFVTAVSGNSDYRDQRATRNILIGFGNLGTNRAFVVPVRKKTEELIREQAAEIRQTFHAPLTVERLQVAPGRAYEIGKETVEGAIGVNESDRISIDLTLSQRMIGQAPVWSFILQSGSDATNRKGYIVVIDAETGDILEEDNLEDYYGQLWTP